jgi:anti-sigma regulatory factor (Ser/Thr protein kinase)
MRASIESIERDGCLVLRVDGAWSTLTATRLHRALGKALASQPLPVVCDLTGLTSEIDASLMAIPAAYAAAGGWPQVVLVVAAAGPVAQSLRSRGSGRRVPIRSTVSAATSAALAGERPDVVTRTLGLSFTPRAAAEARHETSAFCIAVGWVRGSEDARLVVSELATNAVRHGAPPLQLRLMATVRGLTVGISDGSATLPSIRPPRSNRESGRGLLLVDALATTWKVETVPGDGKTVLAQLTLPG